MQFDLFSPTDLVTLPFDQWENSVLPPGWALKKLGEICDTTSGNTPNRKNAAFFQGSVPWVKSGELNHGIITETEECISEDAVKNSSAKVFPAGTLLIALYGATVGKMAVLGIDAATNQAICGIFPKPGIDRQFLYWYLFFKRQELLNSRAGGAQPNISQTILRDLLVVVPPPPEQTRLVARLETLLCEVDAATARLHEAQERLKTYRQAVLYHFLKNEEWESIPLGQLAEVSGGLTKNSKRDLFPLKLPYLRVAHVYANRLDLEEIKVVGVVESEIERTLLQENDLLVVEGNGSIDQVGRVALWDGSIEPCLHQNHLIKVRFDNPVSAKFALKWLLSPLGRRAIEIQASSTSGLHTLSISKVANLQIPFPDLETQRQTVAAIESRLADAEELETAVAEGLRQAEILRQGILKRAFSGQL